MVDLNVTNGSLEMGLRDSSAVQSFTLETKVPVNVLVQDVDQFQVFNFKENLYGHIDKNLLSTILRKYFGKSFLSFQDIKNLVQKGAVENGFPDLKIEKINELVETLEEDVEIEDLRIKDQTKNIARNKLNKIFKKVYNCIFFLRTTQKSIKNKMFPPSQIILKNDDDDQINGESLKYNFMEFLERTFNNSKKMVVFYCILISLAAVIVFIFGFFTPSRRFEALLDNLGGGLSLAFAGKFGILFIVDVMFFLMFRDILTYMRNIKFVGRFFNVLLNEHVTIHKFCSYILVVFVIFHICGHLFGTFVELCKTSDLVGLNNLLTYGKFESLPSYGSLLFRSIPGVTGIFMTLIVFAIFITSFDFIKKKNYEIFAYSHNFYLILCILLYIHGLAYYFNHGQPYAVIYLTPFLIIGLLHHIKKWVQFLNKTPILDVSFSSTNSIAYIKILKPKYFNVIPGQCLYLNAPSISYFQWHPFSICSVGTHGSIKLMIKDAGDFTHSLITQLSQTKKTFILEHNLDLNCNKTAEKLHHDFLLKESDIDKIAIKSGDLNNIVIPNYLRIGIYGPISAPAVSSFHNKNVIFIGCGVGISPYLMFLDEYIKFLKQKFKGQKMKNFNENSKAANKSKISYLGPEDPESKNEQINVFFKNFERINFYYIARDLDQLSWISSYINKLIKYKYDPNKFNIKLFLTNNNKVDNIASFLFWRALGKYQKIKEEAKIKLKTDFLTNLPMEVNYKRPELEKYFQNDMINLRNYNDFYIYGCGPDSFLKSIIHACKVLNKKYTNKFIFFAEKI